jgi:3-oxoacyl-[acyl-carrier protein] reductase
VPHSGPATGDEPARRRAFAANALAGDVVLVTGGDRGIGASIALQAAQAGADVAIGYRERKEAAAEVTDRIRAMGRQAEAYAADIGDPGEARGLVRSVEERFSRIDGLVNNAGIMPTNPFLAIDDDEWDRVIRTDLYSVYYCTQAALPGMLDRGRGRIVNVSSRLGQVGFAGVAHYSAAKAGVIALTKSLAREHGQQGIRVNAVAPGVTNTEMAAGVMTGEVGRKRMAELPLGRFGEPEEVAHAAVFLLTDAASLFLGQTLNPNAGGFMP